MNGLDPKHPARSTIWLLVVLLGVVALFLPTVGPLLDHHFAERQVNHGHVYLGTYQGSPNGTHVHLADVPHTHGPAASAHPTGPANEGIVYLTSGDGNFDSAMPAPVSAEHTALRLPDPPELLTLRRPAFGEAAPSENSVIPPAPPPRA